MKPFLILFLTCGVCIGQSLSIGVIAGARLTDDVTPAVTAKPQSPRFVVGPTLEVALPFHFAAEFDALFHRDDYLAEWANPFGSANESERANSWEFPILLKYKLPVSVANPFVEAGIAPRTISGTVSITGTQVDILTGQQSPVNFRNNTDWSASLGVVVGGGVRFGVRHLNFSPEIRYTRWTSAPITGSFADGPDWRSTQDQLDILVGVAWNIHQQNR